MKAQAKQDQMPALYPSMKGPLIGSVVFHVILFVVTVVGLPFIAKDHLIISTPMSVEIVEIDKITQTNHPSVPKTKTVEKPKPKIKSKEEILAANPLADYHDVWNWGFITTERMTETLYRSLTGE